MGTLASDAPMAPSAAPAGHRRIQSFFSAGENVPASTGGPLQAFPVPTPVVAPEFPEASSAAHQNTSSPQKGWDRSNEPKKVVAYARRKRGAGGGGVSDSLGRSDLDDTRETNSAKHARVSLQRPRGDVAGDDEPSTSGQASGKKEEKQKRCPDATAARKNTKQLFLDLGQKSFGHVTCAVCGLLFAKGEPADEKTHASYHAAHLSTHGDGIGIMQSANKKSDSDESVSRVGGLPCPKRFGFEGNCWSSEKHEAWITRHTKHDHAGRKKVVERVVKHVERTLGLENGWAIVGTSSVFLYVARDKIVGVLVAEPIESGHRTVPGTGTTIDSGTGTGTHVLRKSDKTERATLGVRAVWVHAGWRRVGVAGKGLSQSPRSADCLLPCMAYVTFTSTQSTGDC